MEILLAGLCGFAFGVIAGVVAIFYFIGKDIQKESETK